METVNRLGALQRMQGTTINRFGTQVPNSPEEQARLANQTSSYVAGAQAANPPKPVAQPTMGALAAAPAPASTRPMDATAVADRKMISGAVGALKDTSETAGRAIADMATLIPRGVVGAYDSAVVRPMRAMGANAAYLSPSMTPDGASVDSMTPFSDIKRTRDAQQKMGAATPNTAAPNPASGSPDEKAVGTSQRMAGPVGNAGRGVVAPPGTVLDNGNTAPSDPRSRNFSAELNKVPANLPSDLREGVIHKTVDANGRVTYSGRNVAPGADGSTQMVDGLGKTLQSRGQVLTSNSAPVAGPNGGFAIDNNGPSATERMAQTRATLTNPDGSAWTAADNATMAANIRDGVNPYRGTQRGVAEDKAAQAGQLMTLALSPNGTPGKSNAVKLMAMQETSRTQAAQQQIERDKLNQTAEGTTLENTSKRQMLDAQRAVTSAKTPEERKSAVELLAGLQGKTAQNPDKYAVVPGGQMVIDNQVVTQPHLVLNTNTGQFVQPGQAQGAKPAALPPKDKLVIGQTYPTPRGNAVWDGKQFTPV
ncbi:MAG: hypothetical protein RJB68_2145 [Pseudomonadota bacterium]